MVREIREEGIRELNCRIRGTAGIQCAHLPTITHPMEVQIFGTKKSADTRKALRFFAERRIRTHFVDLGERAAAVGELRRFAQKFGVNALVDREGRAFLDAGLRYSNLSDDRWLEKLAEEPSLLRVPLTRHRHQLTIGLAEEDWARWIAAGA